MLNGAERPTILAGAGCRGAHDELLAIAGALKAPVVHPLGVPEHERVFNNGALSFLCPLVEPERSDRVHLGADAASASPDHVPVRAPRVTGKGR